MGVPIVVYVVIPVRCNCDTRLHRQIDGGGSTLSGNLQSENHIIQYQSLYGVPT